MRQVLCVWFPNWPIQRICVERPELKRRPLVLHSPWDGRAPVVRACSWRASRRGVHAGLPLAEAQVLAPTGLFSSYDPATDREQLRRLAWQCEQWTPRAGLEEADPPENLFLNVTGVTHFGDLPQLCRGVAEMFQSQGYAVKIAAAPTFGAAWALAHADGLQPRRKSVVAVVQTEPLASVLAPLPQWTLRLPEEIRELLAECGLRTIGQVLRLPRESLPSRFGPMLLKRLDQALGTVEELLQSDHPPQPIRVHSRFEFPIRTFETWETAVHQALAQLVEELVCRTRQTQQILLRWQTEDHTRGAFEVRLLRPANTLDRIWRLARLQLEQRQLPEGIVALEVEAIPARAAPGQQPTLFDSEALHHQEFLNLIERLSSRLGQEAVLHYRLIPEAQPELVSVASPWMGNLPDASPQLLPAGLSARPLRLFSPPVRLSVIEEDAAGALRRFQWQQGEEVVACSEGPERIVTGWWRGPMIRRDYYRVETIAGGRWWLFRRIDPPAWFLQGLFE